MVKKIYLDPGHGGHDPGASANGIQEADIVLAIALETRRILNNEYAGATVRMSRTDDTFKTLSWRADDANDWGADYFISIHCNAGGGNGFESYRYSGLDGTTVLQRNMHSGVMIRMTDEAPWIDSRGMKSANFAVLRETNMPAVLTENLFVDHDDSANLLKNAGFLRAVARGHAEGIASVAGLTEIKDGGNDVAVSDKDLSRIATKNWAVTFKKLRKPRDHRISVKHAINWTLYRVDNIWSLLREVSAKLDRLTVALGNHDGKLREELEKALADGTVKVIVQLPEEHDPAEDEPDEGLEDEKQEG